jgi:hypothetical protein
MREIDGVVVVVTWVDHRALIISLCPAKNGKVE